MIVRRFTTLVVALALTACSSNHAVLTPSVSNAFSGTLAGSASGTYATTVKYVTAFYPLWFTHGQSAVATRNRLVGPDRMAPLWHEVVAPNDDTLYGSTYLDLTQQPVVLTIPSTKATWSLLSTDAYGDVYDTGISASGAYAFTAPGWNGTLPSGVTQVKMPTTFSQMIIRSDKYSETGQNQITEAALFRASLAAETLSEYLSNPPGPKTKVIPLIAYSFPYKTVADAMIKDDPMEFLKQLQKAVASSNTPPLSKADQALSNEFNAFLNASNPDVAALSAGARKAHQMILDVYLNNTGTTKWITFSTIGTTWSDLVRSAITEFIQYGNSHATAAYFQTFDDGTGKALDASKHAYVLTFTKDQIPQAKRFWSVTCYIPESITLHDNSLNKYLVGSYTPGLKKSKNGSISIYMAPTQPKGVTTANWLPVPSGPFNLMLRVYGPKGSVSSNTYVPPAVRIFQ